MSTPSSSPASPTAPAASSRRWPPRCARSLLSAADARKTVEISVERQDLGEAPALHQRNVIRVGEAQGPVRVQLEGSAVDALTRQHHARQFDKRQHTGGDQWSGLLVSALEREHRLED